MSTPIFDFGQVLHVPDRGLHVEGAAEVLLDGLRLRGGLDDDEARAVAVALRARFAAAGAFAAAAFVAARPSRPPGPSRGRRLLGPRRLRLLRALRRSPSSLSPSVPLSVPAQKVVARALLAQTAELEREEPGERRARRRAPPRAPPRRRDAAAARAPTGGPTRPRRAAGSGSCALRRARRARAPRARPPPTATARAAPQERGRPGGERVAHVARDREHRHPLRARPARRDERAAPLARPHHHDRLGEPRDDPVPPREVPPAARASRPAAPTGARRPPRGSARRAPRWRAG